LCQNFHPFKGWIIVNCMDILRLSIHLSLAIIKNVAMNMVVQISV